MTAVAHSNQGWIGTLSPRQAEVLELVASGMTNKEVARELWLQEGTVKFHLSDIYGVLNVKGGTSADGERVGDSRVRAARWWWENVEQAQSL